MESNPSPEYQTSAQPDVPEGKRARFQEPWLLRPHRINNLLQVIDTGHFLIEKGLNSDNPSLIRQGWGSIDHVRLRLIRLLEDLVWLARPLELDRQSYEAIDVVDGAFQQIAEHGFKQELDSPVAAAEVPGQLFVDLPAFRVALVGLLSMAMDTPDQFDAIKKVSVTQASQSSCINISYHGYSINPDENERLDRPQAPNEIDRDALWGLEYILATRIIGAHGGQLVCSSDTQELPHAQEISITIPGLPSQKKNSN